MLYNIPHDSAARRNYFDVREHLFVLLLALFSLHTEYLGCRTDTPLQVGLIVFNAVRQQKRGG